MMIKSRTLFFIAIGLLILGIAIFTFSTRNQAHVQVFPATVNRDCAPWDGSAFTVRIPLDDGDVLDISIWQSPDIKFPKKFTFPDETAQVGSATLLHSVGMPESLSGMVFFQRVDQSSPIEGKFELGTENGRLFKGQFIAKWGDFTAICG